MIFTSARNTRVPEVPVHEAVLFNIKDHEDKVALTDGETDNCYTFKQLASAVTSFASALVRQGIGKGDVVAFYAPNSVEYCIATLGCFGVGAVVTGVNFNYTTYELQHQITDSNAKAIVTISANIPKVEEVRKKHRLHTVITVDHPAPNYLYFGDLLKDDGAAYPRGLPINVKDDLAAIMYSSGTTGLPKGVMLTHYNMVANTMSAIINGIAPTEDGMQGVAMGFLPLFHMFGLTLLFALLLTGTNIVTVPGFKPDLFLNIIQKYKISQLFVVPPVVLFLAKSPLVAQYDVSSVKGVLCGAAPLTEDLEREFLSRFNTTDYIIQGYGLTEMTAAVTVASPENPTKFGGSGRLVPNATAKVIDVSTGKILSVGEEGELCFKGPQTMKGYLNRPEATRDMIDTEGWVHTGDVGYFDKDGDLFVTGRIKELIKHKGFQVAPAEVEGLIMTHPGVDDAAVIGIPDEAAGELPRAFVVRKPHSSVSAKEIFDFVKGRLSRHKWLSGGVQFVPSIPKTPSGKIVRREVKKMLTQSKL